MIRRQSRRSLPGLLLLGSALSGCRGEGSDIGPQLVPLPEASYRVVVRNDEDRGVCNAVVTVQGTTAVGVTGRSGRADVPVRIGGVRLISVAAEHASASDGDALVGLTVAARMPDGDELPYVLYLPDLARSSGLTVNAGTQPASLVLNDAASSGAILTIPAGASVGAGTATAFEVRTGRLALEHAPPPLEPIPAGGRMTGAAVFVGPQELTAQPGAVLSMPNELAIPTGGIADLLLLDPDTGVWTRVASGRPDPTGVRLVSDSGAVDRGGLYAFAFDSGRLCEVRGRVVDRASRPLAGILARAPQGHARTDGNGRFSIQAVVAVDGAGQPRTVVLEFHGGRWQRPVAVRLNRTLVDGVLEVDDVVLDTGYTSDFRGLLITRGQIDPRTPIAVSGVGGLAANVGITDRRAEVTLTDIDAGRVGYLITRFDPRDDRRVLSAESVAILEPFRRSLDLRLFMDDQDWITGRRRGTQTFVLDRRGTGRAAGAVILRDRGDGDEFADRTTEFNLPRVDYGARGEATAALLSSSDSRVVASAITIRDPATGRVELPLARANRAPLGRFDRHGLVRGTLPAMAGVRRLRATRAFTAREWFDDVFLGVDRSAALPRRVDPELTGGTGFHLGLPLPSGNLAVVAGGLTGNVFTVQDIVFWSDVRPTAGGTLDLAPRTAVAVAQSFVVPGAVGNSDPAFGIDDYAFDWAIELAGGELVDLARAVGGNSSAGPTPGDVTLRLPGLDGELAGARHWIALGARRVDLGVTMEQKTLLVLDRRDPARVPGVHPLPTISAPSPGESLPADGFQVSFALPDGTLYGVLDLRSDDGIVARDWVAVVPGDATSFTFRRLPSQANTPLAPGNWRLTLAAHRVTSGRLTRLNEPYQRVIARWLGLSALDRSVDAVSAVSIELTLQ
jgi:hypothetical protein